MKHCRHSLYVSMQVQAQKDHQAEQNQRCKDLEASTRQLEERCSELKESAAGHELRAKEAAAEVLKGNRIIEKVSVSTTLSCMFNSVIHGRASYAFQNNKIQCILYDDGQTCAFRANPSIQLLYASNKIKSLAAGLYLALILPQRQTVLPC